MLIISFSVSFFRFISHSNIEIHIYVQNSAHKNLNEQVVEDLELNHNEILKFTPQKNIFVCKFRENCTEAIPLTRARQ